MGIKKTSTFILLYILIVCFSHSCIFEDTIDDKISNIKIHYNPKTLYINDTINIKAVAENQYSEFFTLQNNQWKVSDSTNRPSTVVSIKNNILTALSKGSVRIKTIYNDIESEEIIFNIKEIVTKADTVPVSLTINGKQVIKVGDTTSLKVTAYNKAPSLITNAKIIWLSLDTSTATINTKGLLTAKKQGQVSIQASSFSVPSIKSRFQINIMPATVMNPQNMMDTIATFVFIAGSKNTIEIGETLQLSATAQNSKQQTLSNKPITWYSKNPNIASISANGFVTANASGIAIIHAKASIYIANYNIVVNAKPQPLVAKVILSASKNYITIQQTLSISAKVYNTANDLITDKTIRWVSNNTNIASVSSAGVLTGVAIGTANITGTVDGISSSNFKVNVISKLTRTASMNPVGHYGSGDISITQLNNDSLLVTLQSNFNVDAAISIELHLSNSQTNINSAKIVSSLSNGRNTGPRTFTISNTLVDSYNYAIIWCRPANVRTGFSALFQ